MGEQLFKERASRRGSFQHLLALTRLLAGHAVLRHLQPGHFAERAQRVFELDAVALDYEVDRVPALFAPVAVEVLLRRTDVERRRFLLVERTQADEIFSPALQRDAAADQVDDIGRLENAGLEVA